MPTSAELQTLLGSYIGVGNSWLSRLNLVRARLLEDGSWPGTTPRITLTVYEDADGNSIVTLPRQYLAILRGYIAPTSALCAIAPIGTSGVFNETGYRWNRDFQEVPDYFCVFSEWTTPLRIRLKFEVTELAGAIYLSGNYNGDPVWKTNSGTWENREAVAYTNSAAPNTVTSTKYFDAKGFKLVKPDTLGRVSAYTVTDAGVETLVGVYEPKENLPRWRRYKVPCIGVSTEDYTYVCIARLGYVPVVNSYDEVIPGNTGAIRFGLSALLKEDAEDYVRADQLWSMARDRLVRQSEGESEGTEDHVAVSDDLEMELVGRGL